MKRVTKQPHTTHLFSVGEKTLEIGIATVSNDIHAYAIQKNLQDRYQVTCHIIETNMMANTGKISWSSSNMISPILPTLNTGDVDVSKLNAVWWRRMASRSQASEAVKELSIEDPVAIDVIVNDCRVAYDGIFRTSFKGAWVSHPDATDLFENKLVELQLAKQVGLKIPQTLVSQNPQTIREFCTSLNNQVILKPLAGVAGAAVAATMVTDELLASDQSLQLCPAIYQEMIDGTQHLRINAFGDEFLTAIITSENLDWRFGIAKATVEPYELSATLKAQLQEFLDRAGLRMGIFDMKINLNQEPIWLEINPQGQFLFVEGLSEMKLADAFADFLYREALKHPM
jgi:glutathione synthase/RimK-type ligase-like ATP-grasp enzyme